MRGALGLLGTLCLIGFAQDERQLAKKCGNEIRWEKTLKEAVLKAKESGRLVFAYAFDRARSTMFGNSFKDSFMMCGPFMDLDLVNLINRKFVPVRIRVDQDVAEELGIKLKDIVVPGLLFVNENSEVVYKFDRIATASEELIFYACRVVLDKNKAYDKPSKDIEEYKDDPFRLGLAFLKDGEFHKARETFEALIKSKPDSDEAIESYYRLATVYRRLRKTKECAHAIAQVRALDKENRLKLHGDLMMEEALLLIKQGKYEDAAKVLKEALDKYPKTNRNAEIRYYLGAMHYMAGEDKEARDIWRELVKERPNIRWAWKASANLTGIGPLPNGWESLEWLPEDVLTGDPSSTERPRKPEEYPTLIRSAVEYLIKHQRPNGSWVNVRGQFDFKEAITAICCIALWDSRDILPEQNKAARERALAFLDKWYQRKPPATQYAIWAHIYNLLLYARLTKGSEGEEQKKYLERTNAFVRSLKASQGKDGTFSYVPGIPTSFTAGAALIALFEAREAGADVPQEMVDTAMKRMMALKVQVTDNEQEEDQDHDAYEYSDRPSSQFKSGKFEGACGRMAVCYLAEYVWKKCDLAKLEWALSKFVEHRSRLKRVRKSTDWHSGKYANAPYFFFFDYFYAADGMTRLPAERRKQWLADVRDDLLAINEVDGSWLDWHIGGKNYGTAMALMILRTCGRILHEKDF